MSERKPLPSDLEAAVERLAAEVHAAWVEHREHAGWRYGTERSDAARESPSLVPYERLADEERELDRITVRRTLASLGELGYRIELDAQPTKDASRDHLLARAKHMIARGQPLPAYDLTKRWLAAHPDDREFALHNAWALRRCGALQHALSVLERLGDGPDADGERRGLIAAVHKEMFVRSHRRTRTAALEHLHVAQQLYSAVFDESGGTKYWHGINAATLAALQGREESARAIAEHVWNACAAADESAPPDYWLLATRGEAALVQRQFDVAGAEYRRAVKVAGDRTGDIAATRQNAMLLLDVYAVADAERRAIESALRPPAIVVFAAHGPDLDGTTHALIPPEIESDLRAALDERLQTLNAGFGFSSAAPGAEILFLEAMLERDPGVVSLVLPWPREQYAATHVRAAGEIWQRRFERLFGNEADTPRVHHVVNASLGVGADSQLYERFARQLLFGLARLLADALVVDVVPLLVWNDARHEERDDLGALADDWKTRGIRLTPENVIEIGPLLRRRSPQRAFATNAANAPPRLPSAAPAAQSPFRVMAILFADVEDYSKLPEHQLPAFIEYFVGGIGSRLSLKSYKAENLRRVGDGLLMIFANVRDAGLCALELVEWASAHSQPAGDGETFWSRVGLPREMRLRVALHAGPVFECVDPLTRGTAFEGAHINYAARIEPVTPGNQVYASEAYAALAASGPAPADEFVCEYVGRTSLAKKFGEYPLYHVRRR